MNEFTSYKCICRKVPATPDLLITLNTRFVFLSFLKYNNLCCDSRVRVVRDQFEQQSDKTLLWWGLINKMQFLTAS